MEKMEELGSLMQYSGQNSSNVARTSVVQDFYFYLLYISPCPFASGLGFLCMLKNSCKIKALHLQWS